MEAAYAVRGVGEGRAGAVGSARGKHAQSFPVRLGIKSSGVVGPTTEESIGESRNLREPGPVCQRGIKQREEIGGGTRDQDTHSLSFWTDKAHPLQKPGALCERRVQLRPVGPMEGSRVVPGAHGRTPPREGRWRTTAACCWAEDRDVHSGEGSGNPEPQVAGCTTR